MSTSKPPSNALTIPNIQRIAFFASNTPAKAAQLAYVNKIFMETMISFKSARHIWKQQLAASLVQNKNNNKKTVQSDDDGTTTRASPSEYLSQVEGDLHRLLLAACCARRNTKEEKEEEDDDDNDEATNSTPSKKPDLLFWIPVLMLGNSSLQRLFCILETKMKVVTSALSEALAHNQTQIVDLILNFVLSKLKTIGISASPSSASSSSTKPEEQEGYYFGDDFCETFFGDDDRDENDKNDQQKKDSTPTLRNPLTSILNHQLFPRCSKTLTKNPFLHQLNKTSPVFHTTFETQILDFGESLINILAKTDYGTLKVFFDRIDEIDEVIAERSCLLHDEDLNRRMLTNLLVDYSKNSSDYNLLLMLSTTSRNKKMIKLVLDKLEELGALKDQLSKVRGEQFWEMFYPITQAAQRGNDTFLRLILERARKLKIVNQQLTSCRSQYSVTALGYAVHNGALKAVKILIAHCVSQEQVDGLVRQKDCFGTDPISTLKKKKNLHVNEDDADDNSDSHKVLSLVTSNDSWRKCRDWYRSEFGDF